MPPRTPQKRAARSRGYDSTVSIATASAAKTLDISNNLQEEIDEPQQGSQQKSNDDLKQLIETLKNKIGSKANPTQKKTVPPKPEPRGVWKRSIKNDEEWAPKPAYTVLTRVSNHEKVPTRTNKLPEVTIDCVPHSFLYRPGIDGIKIDKLNIKAGRQIVLG